MRFFSSRLSRVLTAVAITAGYIGVVGAGPAFAVPANDNLANATVIAATPTSINQSVAGATSEPGETGSLACSFFGLTDPGSVWFDVTPTAPGTLTADLTGTSFAFRSVSAWTGAGFPLSEQQGGCGTGNFFSLPVVAGTLYHVRIAKCVAGSCGTNPGDALKVTFTFPGAAPAPGSTLTPAPFDFGSKLIGSSTSQTFTYTNTGNVPLNVTGIALSSASPPFSLSGGTCPTPPFTLAVGASCTQNVTFSPTATGVFATDLNFTGDVPKSSHITGTGVNPPLTVNGSPINFTINQCTTFSGPLGNFTDPLGGPAGAFTVKINWGDGSPVDTTTGTVTQTGPNAFQVSGTHTFTSPGTFPVSTTITAPDGRTLTLTSNATITAIPFQAVSDGDPISGVEGQLVSGITGRFQGPSCATGTPTATIDWGDSTTSPGTVITSISNGVATYEVRGSHTYREESAAGGYQIFTTLTQGTQTAAAKDIATITDAPIHATASPTGVNNGRTAGQVTGTPGTPSTGGLATFTDDNPFGMIGDFTATVDWGDGATTSGSITGPAGPSSGPWQVTGSHQYDCPGTYNVRVIVKDDGGSTDAVVTTATVAPPTNVLDVLINLIRCA